mmetsp:Transcript_10890/g.12370  ORF Transcript_10890/g.12370 Transcript_10890/m.12370 type:complete len:92 (+) Transcript_10890:1953-2228(+)
MSSCAVHGLHGLSIRQSAKVSVTYIVDSKTSTMYTLKRKLDLDPKPNFLSEFITPTIMNYKSNSNPTIKYSNSYTIVYQQTKLKRKSILWK